MGASSGIGLATTLEAARRGARVVLAPRDDDTLFAPRPGDGHVRGNYPGRVMKRSVYTKAALNPVRRSSARRRSSGSQV